MIWRHFWAWLSLTNAPKVPESYYQAGFGVIISGQNPLTVLLYYMIFNCKLSGRFAERKVDGLSYTALHCYPYNSQKGDITSLLYQQLPASGDDHLQQVTTLQYCLLDNCTIMMIETGKELDIVYTTDSLIVTIPTTLSS